MIVIVGYGNFDLEIANRVLKKKIYLQIGPPLHYSVSVKKVVVVSYSLL